MFVKTNTPGYIKDSETGMIVNTNTDEYEAFKRQKHFIKEHNDLKNRLARLEALLLDKE